MGLIIFISIKDIEIKKNKITSGIDQNPSFLQSSMNVV